MRPRMGALHAGRRRLADLAAVAAAVLALTLRCMLGCSPIGTLLPRLEPRTLLIAPGLRVRLAVVVAVVEWLLLSAMRQLSLVVVSVSGNAVTTANRCTTDAPLCYSHPWTCRRCAGAAPRTCVARERARESGRRAGAAAHGLVAICGTSLARAATRLCAARRGR